MPRARNVKPGFFKNERLVELPFATRLLFIGLWTLADREGRLEDRPKRIKMEIFPADDVNIEAALQALHGADLIQRYRVDFAQFIQVVNFAKHQKPHPREAESTIPPPSQGSALDVPRYEEGAPKEVASPAPSLNPSSLNPESLSQRFARWWATYPKKSAKKDARRAWEKLKPDAKMTDRLIVAVVTASKTDQWRRGVIPHPATWLNGQRWEDELGPINGTPAAKPWWESVHAIRVKASEWGIREDTYGGVTAAFKSAVLAEARKRGELPQDVGN